jgi:hypothetical protein
MDTFRKYTECVKPQDYTSIPYGGAIVAALVAVVIAPFILVTNLILVPLAIAADILLIAGAHFYLYGRLVCLDGLQTAMGVVAGVTPPSTGRTLFDKYGDDDATMGIFLAGGPTNFDSDLDAYWNAPQGKLIAPSPAILNVGLSYPTSGNDLKYQKHLHCEFEGSGIYEFLQWVKLVLVILLAILALLLAAPAAAALLILFLKLLALLFGAFGIVNIFLPGAAGDPTDVNPDLRNLSEGDIVVVTGDWIYDSGHSGWNEIHAVHSCQRMSGNDGVILARLNPDGTWPADIGDGMGLDPAHLQVTLDRWKAALADATAAVNGGNQDAPANNWIIHPLIDGCKSTVIV